MESRLQRIDRLLAPILRKIRILIGHTPNAWQVTDESKVVDGGFRLSQFGGLAGGGCQE